MFDVNNDAIETFDSDAESWSNGVVYERSQGSFLSAQNPQDVVSKTYTVPTTTESLSLAFEVRQNFFTNSSFEVEINGATVDLGSAFANGETSGRTSDGIAWTLGPPEELPIGYDSFTPTSRDVMLDVPADIISENGDVTVAFGAANAAADPVSFLASRDFWGVDNFNISATQPEDSLDPPTQTPDGDLILADADSFILEAAIENLTLNSGTAVESLPGMFNTLSDRLDFNGGLAGTINTVDKVFEAKSLSGLSDERLTELGNDIVASMGNWDGGNGFDVWSEKLWQSMDQEYAPASDLGFLYGMGGVASALFFVQNSFAGNVFASAGSVLLATVNAINAMNVQNEGYADIPTDVTFEPTSAFAKVAAELEKRGDIEGAEAITEAVVNGYQAYGDFALNAQTVSLIADIRENGQNARIFEDGKIDESDFDSFKDLGLDVVVTHGFGFLPNPLGIPSEPINEYDVSLKGGVTEMPFDVEFTVSEERAFNYTVEEFEIA